MPQSKPPESLAWVVSKTVTAVPCMLTAPYLLPSSKGVLLKTTPDVALQQLPKVLVLATLPASSSAVRSEAWFAPAF